MSLKVPAIEDDWLTICQQARTNDGAAVRIHAAAMLAFMADQRSRPEAHIISFERSAAY
ncbi:MAG: hypothetical protein E6614_19225 [Bradyrhizobium sp.]|jgi:hypothetical protein|uniref:Uncharacterized protein n=1 Tax=Bradyrhizobium denitrificans TaxID=2734912 RepID=A0ABS5G186_9BRAD|nr:MULTISPECIES: hypothetical protein [Bradyrhizobium]MBR1135029.1 hypothetical protein [Bradyrhizobium denitrificans]MDU0960094.1 hypothetical protein [Bradyrhizobium sp.]MDU1492478.1 hypothetical protein [Bradyrhizobium sp.]MDU1542029.1 hypothetical protein [Bradyrhizobium sp.]MDU1671619.1 hypothetical protein [Bradyrhizobium sp.]